MTTNDKALQATLQKLHAAFPEAVTETRREDDAGNAYTVYAVKDEFIDQLRGARIFATDDDQNRYELQFPGKTSAKAQAFVPAYKTLLPAPEQSVNFDATANVFIEGDNLDALRMLQKSYRGRVKLIYIDPPYNTGGDGFIYADNFSIAQREYLQRVGFVDEDGVRQISELRNGLCGRFHAGWLAMMYPRLALARELLRDDGVMFISIDDNEQANLKLLCDEIFGEVNFVGNIVRRQNLAGKQDAGKLATEQDYVLVYTKNIAADNIRKNVAGLTQYKLSDEHEAERGKFYLRRMDDDGMTYSDKLNYRITFARGETVPVFNPRTKACEATVLRADLHIHPNNDEASTSYNWRWSREKVKWGRENNLIVLKKNKKGEWQVNFKSYALVDNALMKVERANPFGTLVLDFPNNLAHIGVKELFGNKKPFDYPKPIALMKHLINIGANKEGDIVLDFFAGSGTTAHAVMQLNAEDGGARRFIMVQLPEKIDAKKSATAHAFCTQELKRPATIAEIAKERIRRAGAKVRDAHPDALVDTGFRVFTITDSLLSTGEKSPALAETDQSALSAFKARLPRKHFDPLFYEALLHTGGTLDMPFSVHKAGGYPFALCDRRVFCVTEGLTQDIARKIAEDHGDAFDIFHYLSDAIETATSFTELEAAVRRPAAEKKIEALVFY